MNSKPRTYKIILIENFKDIFSLKLFLLPIAVAIIKLLSVADNRDNIFIKTLIDPLVWLYCLGLLFIDAFIRAAYWYFRERNPSYIKKQEAYERQKAEKDATRQSGKEDGESP